MPKNKHIFQSVFNMTVVLMEAKNNNTAHHRDITSTPNYLRQSVAYTAAARRGLVGRHTATVGEGKDAALGTFQLNKPPQFRGL